MDVYKEVVDIENQLTDLYVMLCDCLTHNTNPRETQKLLAIYDLIAPLHSASILAATKLNEL